MGQQLTIIGGIKGFQAFSTQIVTQALTDGLIAQGYVVKSLVFSDCKPKKNILLKRGIEFFLRYFLYPFWCRRQISKNDLVYITDHANAGVINWLPKDVKVVLHCHDLNSLRPLDTFTHQIRLRNRLIHWLSVPTKKKGLQKADHIFAISDFTKKELRRWLKVDVARISVIHNGIDHTSFYPSDKKKARSHLLLPDGHIVMSAATDSYRKNLLLLAEMFSLPEARNQLIHWLHIGRLEDRARRVLQKNGLEGYLIERQDLNKDEMRSAYNAADIFLFPSLYEGFGMPPVEAMACGTPVIAAPTSAIPEILGKAALYAAPDNQQSWLKKCCRLLHDPLLHERMGIEGLQRAQEYQWDRSIEKISLVLKSMEDKSPDTGKQHLTDKQPRSTILEQENL
jgi:glycosyltransferase involved in cell wall biosynthesis